MQKLSSGFLKLYLWSSIFVTTTAIIACFGWYKTEYDMAFKLYPAQKERSEIHRNNALWLGLWGGVYGIIGVTAAGFLLQDMGKVKEKPLPKSGRDYD
jgi:hypothetical protein